MTDVSNILEHISQAIAFVPLLVAFINYKYIKDYVKPMFLYAVASLISDLLVFILNSLDYKIISVLYVYTLVEFTLVSLFFSRFFRKYFNPVFFNVMIFIFIPVTFLLSGLFGFQKSDHYAITSESFIFTAYCLFLFYYVLKNLVLDDLLSSPMFWFNTGILFYFAGNLTIFIFSDYIMHHLSGAHYILWRSIHTFFNVSMNILFSIGFWKTRAK